MFKVLRQTQDVSFFQDVNLSTESQTLFSETAIHFLD